MFISIKNAFLSFQQVLQSLCSGNKSRRLRSASQPLFIDIIAIASGLRPAFLLDYAHISPEDLSRLILAAIELLPASLPVPNLCILEQDDACLITNCELIKTLSPLFVQFMWQNHGGVVASWASVEEQAALQQKLAGIIEILVATKFNPLNQILIIHLESLFNPTNELIMPTLNGCLLGYPVCYAVHDLHEAQAASRCLSTTTLRLFSIFTSLGTHSEKYSNGNSPLLSFSLPSDLIENEEWGRKFSAWEASLRQRHELAVAAGIPWGPISIQETSCMRGIAL